MTPLCFIDTETDGVHPTRRPWEIAMIRRDAYGEREISFYVEIDLSTADPFGLKVGRFWERHPLGLAISLWGADAVKPQAGMVCSLNSAARHVARFTHGAHLIGAVPNFDSEVLARLLREHGILPGWHYHLQDVETLAVGYLRGMGKPVPELPWNSDELMAAIGVEVPTDLVRHTALGDARWAMRTYDKIMG